MPRIPGVSSEQAVRALQKVGFVIVSRKRHIVMFNGSVKVVIPHARTINAFTMGAIAADAGLSPEAFRKLL